MRRAACGAAPIPPLPCCVAATPCPPVPTLHLPCSAASIVCPPQRGGSTVEHPPSFAVAPPSGVPPRPCPLHRSPFAIPVRPIQRQPDAGGGPGLCVWTRQPLCPPRRRHALRLGSPQVSWLGGEKPGNSLGCTDGAWCLYIQQGACADSTECQHSCQSPLSTARTRHQALHPQHAAPTPWPTLPRLRHTCMLPRRLFIAQPSESKYALTHSPAPQVGHARPLVGPVPPAVCGRRLLLRPVPNGRQPRRHHGTRRMHGGGGDRRLRWAILFGPAWGSC